MLTHTIELFGGSEVPTVGRMVLIIELVTHNLRAQLRRHTKSLQFLDEGFSQRMEATLSLGPVFANDRQVPAECFGNPISLTIESSAFGLGEQALMARRSPALHLNKKA